MPNHLADADSPYLLQHASNPVDWYPWGEDALSKARAENKPIFLSIGYSACHWCHVMAHESFEDLETAAIMNEHFVCIKVDREQRPDLDAIYMQATTSLAGSGGWPMSVFLTPDLRPFYAGTYFPPVRRHGLPAFRDVLLGVARAWREETADVKETAAKVTQRIGSISLAPAQGTFSEPALASATDGLLESYDWKYGGWGSAPKFPQPMVVEYLLLRSMHGQQGDRALKAATHALRAMVRGGMYDVVGGGFSRYSTDVSWHIPHFEKMLYDNALLGRAYLHAWQLTGEPLFERIVCETLDFVEREVMTPEGAFYSSLDADAEGEEGKFYVWTQDEIRRVIGEGPLFQLFTSAYAITDRGNWDGRIVLQRALDDGSLAARLGLDTSEVQRRLTACHQLLLQARAHRVRPATDDKVITSWNSLMLRTFAEAGTCLNEASRRERYLETATRNAGFLLKNLRAGGILRHSWRRGQPGAGVFLEDFGASILGLLQLYQADFNNDWFLAAGALADEMLERFPSPSRGFFDTPYDAPTVLFRPQDIQDNATPCGNSLAAEALLAVDGLVGGSRYRDALDSTLGLAAELAPSYPTALANWLSAAERSLRGVKQVALLYPAGRPPASFLQAIRGAYRPEIVLAASSYPPRDDAPALLRGRGLKDDIPTAFVCHDFVCDLPVTSPEELAGLL